MKSWRDALKEENDRSTLDDVKERFPPPSKGWADETLLQSWMRWLRASLRVMNENADTRICAQAAMISQGETMKADFVRTLNALGNVVRLLAEERNEEEKMEESKMSKSTRSRLQQIRDELKHCAMLSGSAPPGETIQPTLGHDEWELVDECVEAMQLLWNERLVDDWNRRQLYDYTQQIVRVFNQMAADLEGR